MRTYKFVSILAAVALIIGLAPVLSVGAQSGSVTRQIPAGGTTSLKSGPTGVDGLQWPEFAGGEGDAGPAPRAGPTVNRSLSKGSRNGVSVNSGKKPKSNPALDLSFNGLNHRNQRLANGGNQFSLEPPDQGLCIGNGFVLETVNSVLRVYDTAGNPVTGVVDQNTFYGYPAQFDRTTGLQGPFITDPSCYYDGATQRWFHVVLTLEVDPITGNFLGPNHLDLAVSQTPDPTGAWTIYRIPAQNDGTDGTPDHHCPLRNDGTGHGACYGDYPHIGADANGFYITTNEYALFPDNIYMAAQVYAFSKRALASGASTVSFVQFDTTGMAAGKPGFTVWPAVSPDGQYKGQTEYFLSSDAAGEVSTTGTSDRIFLWKLSKTSSLDSSSPSLSLTNVAIPVGMYAIPPRSDQKPGNIPLADCINDTTLPTPFGPGCWQLIFFSEPAHNEVEVHIDSNDTRMQQVMYANGKVWGALDTAVTVGGANKAGIEWFILNPDSNKVDKQGYLALENNNLTYPAVGVTKSGRGVIAFTLVGADYYPSAAYASLDAVYGVGDIQLAAAGLGPDDGFTGYNAFQYFRPRWGDYGAAVTDGNAIWIASEYIGQTCTFNQYIGNAVGGVYGLSGFGSCSGTRTALGNWYTRVSKVTP